MVEAKIASLSDSLKSLPNQNLPTTAQTFYTLVTQKPNNAVINKQKSDALNAHIQKLKSLKTNCTTIIETILNLREVYNEDLQPETGETLSGGGKRKLRNSQKSKKSRKGKSRKNCRKSNRRCVEKK